MTESDRLIDVLAGLPYDGYSAACVRGIGAAEAAQRLAAEPVGMDELAEIFEDVSADPALRIIGLSDVPGGCVVSQEWAYMAANPVVMQLLSAGTVAYGMFANPKSGNQGRVFRDGALAAWDTDPGGNNVSGDDSAAEILLRYLYSGQALAYCYASATLRPTGTHSITNPDTYLRLPNRNY
ncbi:DUF6461 domain-containing protein [Nonomuraea sp. NPDC050404]|uniref:DUF6461 domain-containing protein n=1 Tax=Nonomuraea sp. NPDC050404 TaxID=3155783 RepID=UPI00341182CB